MLLPLLFVFSSVMTVYSSPLQVVNPLDAQLPVIARINQPFSWTFCNDTFRPNDSLVYSTSSLPGWLSFDSKTRTFSGTPSEADEGNPKITVTASDPSTSVSSTFTFCVTPFPPPTLEHSISEQFTPSNTALSSVFVLAPNSALATANPALRIPPQWSFSIGFQYDTFVAKNGLFYAVLQSGGAALPEWLYFDSSAMTLNGFTPNNSTTLALALHASDQEGYTASKLFFDLCISPHELSISTFSMPTINVTASTPFNITLSSPADYAGVLVDAKPIQPSEIQSLTIDVSGSMQWLKYDNASRMLSGDPGDHSFSSGQNLSFPFILVAYNQSIQSKVSLAFVPSYFSKPLLDPIQAIPGSTIQFNLAQDYSNATGHDDVKLSAEFESTDVMEWLHFNCDTGQLAGTLPANFSSTRIGVTFTAYSRITHSTSHTTLPIVVASADRSKKGSHPGGLSALAHKKLVLGLTITFGVVGGLILIGGLLAAFRRYARVDDTATGGEAGRNVWNDQDKRWYGLDKVMNRRKSIEAAPPRGAPDYGRLGLGLRRVSERSQSERISGINSPIEILRNPAVMSKREFMTRIKDTVRIVSNKAREHGRKRSGKRLIIGKPILRSSQQPAVPPTGTKVSPVVESPSNPFDRPGLPSHPGSTIMTNSPSASTAEHSIPRRRADFAPPRSPAQAHLEDTRLSRQLSTGSTGSLASDTSAMTHAAEAVIQNASKAISIRSGKSGSGISHPSAISEPAQATVTRPRLVPFTSAARVPIPRRPSSPFLEAGSSTNKRVASQTAKVWKSRPLNSDDDVGKSPSGDELRMGVHYMQSLGEEHTPGENVLRTLVRVGEKFVFRVPVPPASPTLSRARVFEVKLISGEPLPVFLQVDMGETGKGVVKFSGMPTAADLGELAVGVYTSEGICVSQMILEVVQWR